MMPKTCPACGRFALSLVGQIEQLDSYYLAPEGPPPDTAGYWHTKCLRKSAAGAAWGAARLRNFVDVRGYRVVSRGNCWCVLEDPRDSERVAIADTGQLLVLPSAQRLVRVDGETVYRERKGEYNLQLPDVGLIESIQGALLRDGECPLSILIDGLQLAPNMDHAEILADARFLLDEDLREEEWGADSLCAAIEYNVSVPSELVARCV